MSDISIPQATQQLSGTYGKSPVQVMLCTVQSASKADRTATVVPVTDNLGAFPVQLMSDVADGMLIIPATGSTVRVLLSELSTPCVIEYSEVSEVYIVTGGQLLRIYSGGLELDGTSFGGIMKVTPSVAAWNAIQDDINSLKQGLIALNTALAGSGSSPITGLTWSAAFTSSLATYAAQVLARTTQSQIENTKVKHGNGS